MFSASLRQGMTTETSTAARGSGGAPTPAGVLWIEAMAVSASGVALQTV